MVGIRRGDPRKRKRSLRDILQKVDDGVKGMKKKTKKKK